MYKTSIWVIIYSNNCFVVVLPKKIELYLHLLVGLYFPKILSGTVKTVIKINTVLK